MPKHVARFDRDSTISLEDALREVTDAMRSAQPRKEHPWRFVSQTNFDAIHRASLPAVMEQLSDAAEALQSTSKPVRSLLDACRTQTALQQGVQLLDGVSRSDLPPKQLLDSLLDDAWMASWGESITTLRSAVAAARTEISEVGIEAFALEPSRVKDAVQNVRDAARSVHSRTQRKGPECNA